MSLHQGRLGDGGPDPTLTEFSRSLDYDRALVFDDLDGSRAHVRALGRAGILAAEEVDEILAALSEVEREARDGSLWVAAASERPDAEDVHTVIEWRVTELAGAAGAKLHSGRSRNDQVATALRLYVRRSLHETALRVLALQETLVQRAQAEFDAETPIVGYTHLQRAQPVLLAHHLLAHVWALGRDVERLDDVWRRADSCPLGAGALAGTWLALDPPTTAATLGFSGAFDNSLDAVSDRDFVADALYALALLGTHLSRMGEELVLWTSDEFGFAVLDDRFSTGSSLMPQKKNPDVAELARGKAGRLIGNLTGFLATLKGLPLAYNRDLQEDKEPLFDSFAQVQRALDALRGMYATLAFDRAALEAAASSPLVAATDLAEILVEAGVPFRHAHELVGSLVRRATAAARETGEAPDLIALASAHETFRRFGEPVLAQVRALADPSVSLRRRRSHGGGGPAPVEAQLSRVMDLLADERDRLGVAAADAAGEGTGDGAGDGVGDGAVEFTFDDTTLARTRAQRRPSQVDDTTLRRAAAASGSWLVERDTHGVEVGRWPLAIGGRIAGRFVPATRR